VERVVVVETRFVVVVVDGRAVDGDGRDVADDGSLVDSISRFGTPVVLTLDQ
jgi:hypothetical protein